MKNGTGVQALAFYFLLMPAQGLAAREPKRFHELSPEAVADELKVLHAAQPDYQQRLVAVSERFLGARYRLGPLGEGPDGEFDRDPLVDFRAMDCTTLVEQTMALAQFPDLKLDLELLRLIRYKKGRVRYESRNHFPETDWIPNNAAAGFLEDVTRRVAGAKTRRARKVISKRRWYEGKRLEDLEGFGAEPEDERRARLERLRALGGAMKDEAAVLDYLPIERLAALAPRIPSGTIANLVRAEDPAKPVLVSHQVFIIEKGGERFVRHASSSAGIVVDEPLMGYVARYAGSKWPLLGLNLSRATRPRDRGHQ